MYYEQTTAGYILRIRVTPNASKCGIGGIFTDNNNQDFLKISLNSVPEKGKANQELIKILSKSLNQSKSCFSIIAGQTDRYKKVLLEIEPSAIIDKQLRLLEKSE